MARRMAASDCAASGASVPAARPSVPDASLSPPHPPANAAVARDRTSKEVLGMSQHTIIILIAL